MIIQRRLRPRKKSFFLLGARGTGKSTWLKGIFKEGLFLDLLDEDLFFQLQTDKGLLGRILEQAQQEWIIIDEFQRIPELLNTVHRYIEKGKKFVLSGSSARKLKRTGVNLLAGRALDLRMHPFLPSELGSTFSLEKALHRGLLPSVYFDEEAQATLHSYTTFYIKQEIQAEALVRNLPSFLRFLKVSSLCHGQPINLSTLAREAEISRSTATGHLEILIDTLLAHLLPAFTPKLRIREKHSPKFFLFDCGIARVLKHGSNSLQPDDLGHLFEGLLLQILLAYKEYDGLCEEISYWAPSKSSIEVDFILQKGDEFIAIEAKYTQRIRKEHLKGLESLSNVAACKRRILVYPGTLPQKTEDQIEILPFSLFEALLASGTLFK